jgi:integrase
LLNRCSVNHWPYKSDKRELLELRDNALVAILYNCELRISEARRLTKDQFIDHGKRVKLIKVKLSKAEKRNRKTGEIITRKDLYRKEIILPSKGARGELSAFLIKYLGFLGEKDPLFNIGNSRIDKIVKCKMGIPPHWLRAYGENHLYELWDYDLIAVANFVQVDPRTLAKYIHRVPDKYLQRE